MDKTTFEIKIIPDNESYIFVNLKTYQLFYVYKLLIKWYIHRLVREREREREIQ